jgi:VanZ family protein
MIKKNIFSILVALLIMYLSLTSSHTFDKVPVFKVAYLDKIVHFFMYFGLMSVILIENRKNIKTRGHLFLIALIALLYGILMEFLQSVLTITRSGSVYDVIANIAGILVSALLWLWIKPLIKEPVR